MNLKDCCPRCGKKLINFHHNKEPYKLYYCDDCHIEILITNAYYNISFVDVVPEN